ncbi:MAG: lamin tail domain-containing protein, partial [Eubacteriales bacterium]|nr:lamin tail domain-containing protein [Eubacteriales bacterium]
DVLGPVVYNSEDDNDNSLVLRLGANGRSFLFTGDMQFAEEGTLLAAGVDLQADVLKVGNHGNPDATSQMFAAAVSPKIAVISTSTVEDADSANERVTSLFDGARVLVTEGFTRGALLRVSASGEIKISSPQPPSPNADIEIVEIDKNAQTITLINNGTEMDISGYMIFSQRGSEVYVFPQGTVMNAGQILTIACTDGEGDLIWNDKKVWHAEKDDVGVLYDRYSSELSRFL